VPRPGALLTSHATGATPSAQSRREQALLEGAALGELHLHVSSLAGDVLALGAFHQQPRPPRDAQGALWRRRSGGCAVASGAGFLIVTLGLPHRSALVADEPYALRPEQVMNRCVRGLLAWLRGAGLDPLYPGLDAVTIQRRVLARLGFAETADGPTLFQAIIARDASFGDTPALLDRLDPDGRVPLRLEARDATTSLVALGRAAPGEPDVAALTGQIAAAHAATFPDAIGEIAELDPAVTALLETADALEDATEHPAPELPATPVVANGLLGPVATAARIDDGRVAALALTGDFIAPEWSVAELCARIERGAATADAVRAALRAVLDGNRGYLLGLAPDALDRLLVRAVTEAA
jgi:hypothetical protein